MLKQLRSLGGAADHCFRGLHHLQPTQHNKHILLYQGRHMRCWWGLGAADVCFRESWHEQQNCTPTFIFLSRMLGTNQYGHSCEFISFLSCHWTRFLTWWAPIRVLLTWMDMTTGCALSYLKLVVLCLHQNSDRACGALASSLPGVKARNTCFNRNHFWNQNLQWC